MARRLKVPQAATVETIKAAYRRRAKRAHVDAGGSHEAMVRVNAAYDRAKRERGFA